MSGLLIGRRKKVQFRGILRDKFAEKSRRFCGKFGEIFRANFFSGPILWLFLGQILVEIDWFCADQTSIFNVLLTEVIICSFNYNTLQK